MSEIALIISNDTYMGNKILLRVLTGMQICFLRKIFHEDTQSSFKPQLDCCTTRLQFKFRFKVEKMNMKNTF